MAAKEPRRAVLTKQRWVAVVLTLLVALVLLVVAFFVVDSRGGRFALTCLAALVAAGGPLLLYVGRGRSR